MGKQKLYVVDKGQIFYGSAEQWADCFFSNVTDEAVRDFCDSEGWELDIIEDEPIDFSTLASIEDGDRAILEQLARHT